MRDVILWVLRFGIVELLTVYVVFVNILTFSLYIVDKRKAIKGKRRIKESTLLFLTFALGGVGALCGMCFAKHKTRSKKFRLSAVAGLFIAFVTLVHITHALTLDKTIRYIEIDFHSENWPKESDGYRIAFMSDMHGITDEAMREVIAELNARNLDLLLLGGDFSMYNDNYQGTLREIAQTNTTDGIFGVDGNHDDYQRIFAAMERHGITLLDNGGIHIREGFFLAGVQDMWRRNPNIYKAVTNAYTNDFILLISHNPDVTMVQSTSGIDLILSGHTHNGHITFFGFPVYLLTGHISRYGTRFAHGFAESADGVPVYVSGGVGDLGYGFTVPRVFARPEVVIFTLYNQ
jgi:hypothetical protein